MTSRAKKIESQNETINNLKNQSNSPKKQTVKTDKKYAEKVCNTDKKLHKKIPETQTLDLQSTASANRPLTRSATTRGRLNLHQDSKKNVNTNNINQDINQDLKIASGMPEAVDLQDRIEARLDNSSEDDFKTVSYKRNRKPKNFLVGNGTANNSFAAADKKVWLYIGKVKNGVTVENIIDYLNIKLPDQSFSCDQLPSRGSNLSFRVGASFDLKSTLEDPDFWPCGVHICRFNFFRFRRLELNKEEQFK